MPADPFRPWLARWALTADGAPFRSALGNHLLPVICEGAAAILKIAAHEEERRGTALLVYYAGAGAVRVLASEGDAILLERAAGRKSLSRMSAEGEDDEATRILCEVAGLLHAPRLAPPPTALVPLDTWFQPLADAAAAYGGAFAAPAATAAELLREPRDPVPLHGDLHHSNVLDGGPRGWLAIDPKALIGERGFDFANLFRNPNFDVARAPGRLRHRAGIVAERAGLDARRLLQWVLAYAGLGAAWSLEDGEDPALNLAIAETAAAELRSTG